MKMDEFSFFVVNTEGKKNSFANAAIEVMLRRPIRCLGDIKPTHELNSGLNNDINSIKVGILLTTKLTAFIADVCHIRCLASAIKTLLVFSVPLMQHVEPNTIYFNNDSRPDLTVFKHRS